MIKALISHTSLGDIFETLYYCVVILFGILPKLLHCRFNMRYSQRSSKIEHHSQAMRIFSCKQYPQPSPVSDLFTFLCKIDKLTV